MTALDELRVEVLRVVGQYGSTEDHEAVLPAVVDLVELQPPHVVVECMEALIVEGREGNQDNIELLWHFGKSRGVWNEDGVMRVMDLDELHGAVAFLLINERNGALDAALDLAIVMADDEES